MYIYIYIIMAGMPMSCMLFVRHVSAHMPTYTYIHTYRHQQALVYIYTHTNIHTYRYTDIQIYTHTHTHTYKATGCGVLQSTAVMNLLKLSDMCTCTCLYTHQ
jgi:hypothetical protein